MKAIFLILVAVLVISLAVPTTPAQRRRRAPARPNAAARAAEQKAEALRAARTRVAAQVNTLTQFLYLYGGIAKGIESTDKLAGTQEVSTAALEQNRRSKTKVIESLRNMRAGLDQLENDFRFNVAWKGYFPHVSGVAVLGETAESQAAANRFDDAGRSLLKAVNRLTDALIAMR